MRQKSMVMGLVRLGDKKDSSGEAQQQMKSRNPISRQRDRPTSRNPQMS
jgi:hypothetical protein